MPKLAKEYGMNHANVCKLLRARYGETWTNTFQAVDLNISETVTFTVPRLLPERTIRAVHHRLAANRTYLHGKPKYEYLLGGRIFCASCGYAFFGQVNKSGRLYYRHAHSERVRECPLREPRPWIRADVIEEAVVRDLFKMLGNHAEIERAVKAAMPDYEKTVRHRDRLGVELSKIEKARMRVLDFVERDAITDVQAEAKLRALKERDAVIRVEWDGLEARLSSVHDADSIRRAALQVVRVCDGIYVEDEQGNRYLGGNDIQSYLSMSRPDKETLVDAAFGENLADGTPAGVYISPAGGKRYGPKRFRYVVRGLICEAIKGVTPRVSS